jgi:hypothetical protein
LGKSGLKMLAPTMALELGRHQIAVNLIAPGFVDTGLSGKLYREQPGPREAGMKLVPLGYIMTAAEVAAAVMMLCSSAVVYMTGSTLLIDGGNSLFLREGNASWANPGRARAVAAASANKLNKTGREESHGERVAERSFAWDYERLDTTLKDFDYLSFACLMIANMLKQFAWTS